VLRLWDRYRVHWLALLSGDISIWHAKKSIQQGAILLLTAGLCQVSEAQAPSLESTLQWIKLKRIYMELKKRSRLKGWRVAGFVLTSTMAFAGSLPTLAAEPVTVFGANPTVVRLDKLSPPLTEGLRAILAMYTLQSGAGCEDPVPDKKLSCALNTALKVGPQCSDTQLQLVGAWFKSVPKMSGDKTDSNKYVDIQPPGSLKELCLSAPDDGAGNVQIWTSIKVTQDGGKVLIDAEGTSAAGDDGETQYRYKTTYQIQDHSITALSHEMKVLRQLESPQ
jgi:hypothetical protein